MKDLIITSGVVGALLPVLLAVINQSHWASGFKSVVAFVVCIIAAVVTLWATGELDITTAAFSTENLLATFLSMYVATQVFYRGFWKPTGAAPAIEENTTISDPPPP